MGKGISTAIIALVVIAVVGIITISFQSYLPAQTKPVQPSTIPRLGNLCAGEENCKDFCLYNRDRCEEYCRSQPENELCQKPFEFERGSQEPPTTIDTTTPTSTNPVTPVTPSSTTNLPANTTIEFTIAAAQAWVPDVMTQPIPIGASKTRLTALPAPIDKILIEGGYGAHLGGHVEGLDHEWIGVEEGTPVGSWADGEVTMVFLTNPGVPDDWRIHIDYGDGLSGEHMDVGTPLVKVGDKVKAGDPVAYGIGPPWTTGYHTAEFNLVDKHRIDGVQYRDGVTVSPFDYLRDDLRQQLVDEFTIKVIEPYIAKGVKSPFVVGESLGIMNPWEPYLTNPLIIHDEHKGTLVGEWYLKSKNWGLDDAPDLLTFLPTTKYYSKHHMEAGEDATGNVFGGVWEADYGTRQLTIDTGEIYKEAPYIYYGIFELDESGPRATLKIEYKRDSYPAAFSGNALVYAERTAVGRRQDAVYMGVRSSLG